MGVINQASLQFQKLVGLYENPLLEYWTNKFQDNMKASIIYEIFQREQSSNPTEAIGELTGSISFREWAGQFTYQDMKEGNTKVFTPVVWEAGRAFDRFTLSNAKLIDLKNKVDDFALGAARLREQIAGGFFSNATSTSFVINGKTIANTTADGIALASASHTGVTYTTAQSNYGTDALGEKPLEDACQAMFEYKDDEGNECNLSPDTIVVPTRLRQLGLELIGGAGKYNVANNNPNIYKGSMRLVVWPWLKKASTATNYPWFVMDSQAVKKSCKWINRLESGEDHEISSYKDWETQTWKIGSLMWFTAGMYDWRPFYINVPA
jgi:hypothetical protein